MSSWVCLFSGGKDSSWALYHALEAGYDVDRLLTVHPAGDSYMYHTPATHLAGLAAESIGIDLQEIEPEPFDAESATDAGEQGDSEIEPLETALRESTAEIDLAGVIAGAVESEFQTSRIRSLCDRLDIDLYAPLWGKEPETLLEEMLAAGFDIRIVQVAAYGLDVTWLGRQLNDEARADLRALNEEYGVHILGEGGEFETFVVDGPHMDRRIELEYESVWEGDRGHLDVTGARLIDE